MALVGGFTSCWGFESGMSELYRYKGKADFRVGGVSARQFGSPTPQDDIFNVYLQDAPVGATVVKAYATWSYMTNFLGDAGERTIKINGNTIGPAGTSLSYGDIDLNWQTAYAVTYTADITAIVQAGGFGALYEIESAVDDPVSGGLAEGFSIIGVYSHPDEPDRDVSLYKGYTGTRTGDASGTMTFDPYDNSTRQGVHFFLNALDGQKDDGPNAPMTDEFYINYQNASVEVGGEVGNAWQGKKRYNFIAGDPNHLYDHADIDVAAFMSFGDTSLFWDTDGFNDFGNYTDAIGHSFGAIAVPVPEPGTLIGVGLGALGIFARRRRVAAQKEKGR